MKISEQDFFTASQEIVSYEQSQEIWQEMQNVAGTSSEFNFTNILYYFGGMIVIASMTWLMNSTWEHFGHIGMMMISLAYMAGFLTLGYRMWFTHKLTIPGGLMYVMVVCLVPLLTYSIQGVLGWWGAEDPGNYGRFFHWIKGGWFMMEIFTIIAGIMVLRWIKFPFLMMPITVAMWYLSMDIVPLMLGKEYQGFGYWSAHYELRRFTSMLFGLVMILLTLMVDRRTKQDFAFWGYLFGVIAFWGGLSLMKSDSEIGKFCYFLINITMIFASAYLSRRIFVIFGSVGAFWYFEHLADRVFRDSFLFPFALMVMGMLVIYAGIHYQRNKSTIDAWLMNLLPNWVEALRPIHRIESGYVTQKKNK